MTKGDATGYAYTEDLAWEKMAHAARTAGQIAAGGGAQAGRRRAAVEVTAPSFYAVPTPSLVAARDDKLALLRAADKAARAYDPRIVKVEASFAEAIKEVLLFTSDGRMAQRRPAAAALRRARRRRGRAASASRAPAAAAAATAWTTSRDAERDAAAHGREAARVAIAMLDAREAPAGEMPVVLGPGDSGILLHEAVGHGLEADFNRKQTSNYTGQIGKPVASPLCTVVDDGTIASSRGAINVDDEGNAGAAATC